MHSVEHGDSHVDVVVKLDVVLATEGDSALVLHGGLGKKARAAVRDAVESRPDGSGIVLVATGLYLGEWFDWPELDTTFLASLPPSRGRVVQYVGRLLRTTRARVRSKLRTRPASRTATSNRENLLVTADGMAFGIAKSADLGEKWRSDEQRPEVYAPAVLGTKHYLGFARARSG